MGGPRQRKALEEQLRGEIEQQQSRLASLSEELLQLREAKFGVDAAALEAKHRAAAAEGTLVSLEVDNKGLRQRCAAAAADKAQSAADCAVLRSRLASAEEKVSCPGIGRDGGQDTFMAQHDGRERSVQSYECVLPDAAPLVGRDGLVWDGIEQWGCRD